MHEDHDEGPVYKHFFPVDIYENFDDCDEVQQLTLGMFDDYDLSLSTTSTPTLMQEESMNTPIEAVQGHDYSSTESMHIGPKLQSFIDAIRSRYNPTSDSSIEVSDNTLATVVLDMFMPLFPPLRPQSDDFLLGLLLDFIVNENQSDSNRPAEPSRPTRRSNDPSWTRRKNRRKGDKYNHSDKYKEKQCQKKKEEYLRKMEKQSRKEHKKKQSAAKKAYKTDDDWTINEEMLELSDFEGDFYGVGWDDGQHVHV